jgi:predicted double-glycine peptidase
MITRSGALLALLLISARGDFTHAQELGLVGDMARLENFPLIEQPDDISCGAASAAMVLKYYSIDAGIGPIKTDAGTRWLEFGKARVGMTLPQGIKMALQKRGVDAEIYRVSLDNLMQAVRDRRPAIVLVRSSATTWHWFVIIGYRHDGADYFVSDPAGQQYWLPANVLEPAMTFSHDSSGRPCGDRRCESCGGNGQMTNLDCPICDGGWIKKGPFKTKCPSGCNGGRITAQCRVCNGSGNSPDFYRKAVESAGISGHTVIIPHRPAPRAGSTARPHGENVVRIHYTIVNDSGHTVRFHMQPSSRRYLMTPGQTFRGTSNQVDGKAPTITLEDSGRTYRLTEGNHRFWWMNGQRRIGFDRESD